MCVSIITITKNNGYGLQRTLESVSKLRGFDGEFVVVDGHSRDSTDDIVKKYYRKVNQYLKDGGSGIYAAMNQGIRAAAGDWLIFVNAGDVFVDEKVISEVALELDSEFDFVFGKALRPDGSEKHAFKGLANSWKEMPFCHQAVFNHRRVFGDRMYDESYKIAGDHEFYIWAARRRMSMKRLDRVIAVSELGGISERVFTRRVAESYRAARKHYPFCLEMHHYYWRKLGLAFSNRWRRSFRS